MENSGKECEGESEEARQCELQSCPIDGVWGDWQDWTECSAQCDEGETKRGRSIETPAQFGGKTCEGSFYETETCITTPCPVDCAVSEWESAGVCTVSCGGGTRPESRSINTPKAWGGEECPSDLVRDVVCNEDECPVDCIMSEWQYDGSCSVTCGGGEVKMVRAVLQQSAFGGVGCETELEKMVTCGEDECPVNCVWGPWSGWPECSTTCGEARVRKRARRPCPRPMVAWHARGTATKPRAAMTRIARSTACGVTGAIGAHAQRSAATASTSVSDS
jgi:hypothetical protein